MRFIGNWRWLCVVPPLVAAAACDQSFDRLTAPHHAQMPGSLRAESDIVGTPLHVASVEQLYAAVNDVANAGVAIVMEPGTYILSATNAGGAARPNAGRLELQPDMSLYGVTGDRSAVVIDARTLPTSSFNVSFGRTAPLRIGRGSNAVEWLTVLGPPTAAAGIATEITGTPTTRVRVAHVFSSGASRGVDVRNVGASMIGRQIEAEVIDNEFVGPAEVIGMSEGIRVANFVGADNGVIVATMSGNRAHGFQIGCIVANNRSSNASITVRSSGDRFYDNALGCSIAGGLSQTTGVANGNHTAFEAHGTQFVDNTADLGFRPGGLDVVGGLSTTQPNVTSNNVVSVSLWGSKSEGNLGEDFEAFGAWMGSLTGVAGTGNHVTIQLHGVSKQIDVSAMASLPLDPGNTNVVTIIR
jgi:hypothetical protein